MALIALTAMGAGVLGLPRAQAADSIQISVSASFDGTNVNISGGAYSSVGQALPGLLITIWLNNSGGASTVTMSDGTYSYAMASPGAGSYTIHVQWSGDARYLASSATTFIAIPQAETSLTLALDPSEVVPGSSVTVTGSLTAGGSAISSALVTLSVDYGNVDSSASTGGDGGFVAGLTIPQGDGFPATFTVTASFDGDNLYTAASNRATGSIVAPPNPPAEAVPSDKLVSTPTATMSTVISESSPTSGMMNAPSDSSNEGRGSPMTIVSIVFFAVALVSVGTLVILGVVSHAQKRLGRDERRGFGTNFGKMW